ncbi:MAG: HPF/RaiA family ribosome-associated protein [Acidimicrobiia bacterium]
MKDSNDSNVQPAGETPEIVFVTDGLVPDSAHDQATKMIHALSDRAQRPVIFSRVKILVDMDRPPDERAVIQVVMDVSGELIRAQVSAPTAADALNTLSDRLERRLRKLAERRRDTRRRPPATPEGTWRSGDLPTARPDFYERPREERRVVRRKTFAPDAMVSVAEAIYDLDVLDHRFFLFTDTADGEMSIVYEQGEKVMLRRLSGGSPEDDSSDVADMVNPTPAPELAVEEASDWLDATDEEFVFFRNKDTGDANVLYRRYDGHYGLVEPKVAG